MPVHTLGTTGATTGHPFLNLDHTDVSGVQQLSPCDRALTMPVLVPKLIHLAGAHPERSTASGPVQT